MVPVLHQCVRVPYGASYATIVSPGSPSAPRSLIVPNRPDERSATRGPTHGRLRATAAKFRDHRDFAAGRDDGRELGKRIGYPNGDPTADVGSRERAKLTRGQANRNVN